MGQFCDIWLCSSATGIGNSVLLVDSPLQTSLSPLQPFSLVRSWRGCETSQANEYAAFVTLTEDGKQISKIEEMVDTAFFAEMDRQGAAHAAAAAAAANPTTTVSA